MSGLKKIRSKNIASVTVDPAINTSYNQQLQSSLQKTVWNSGGCVSYFLDKNGQNSSNWPWTTFYMRKRMGNFNLNDYLIE